jgi:hypothetical protein
VSIATKNLPFYICVLNKYKMKKLSATLITICLATLSFATTRTLNNNVPSPGQFNTWTAILAASSAGDTILVQGSPYNYGTFNLTKRLTIIGPGHNNTDKQNPQKATVDYIEFRVGSTGSKVYGMEIYYPYIPGSNPNVDSVTLALNRITYQFNASSGAANDWIFDGNIFVYNGYNVDIQGQSFGGSIFRNNIFNGEIYAFNAAFTGYNYFINNIFLGDNPWTFNYCNNIYVNNNIFYRQNPNAVNGSCTYNNNIGFGGVTSFPNGVNTTGVDPLFVTSIGSGAFFNYATDYHLQAGSPFLTYGTDGTQVGVYGGTGDYNQHGVPRNPYIKTFNLTGPTSINAGDNLQIYIKAKVRN